MGIAWVLDNILSSCDSVLIDLEIYVNVILLLLKACNFIFLVP